jgi:hypothetical protein
MLRSDQSQAAEPASGAAPRIAPAGAVARARLVPLMSRRQRTTFAVLVLLWLLALGNFWAWWLTPEHNIGTLRFVANSLLPFWTAGRVRPWRLITAADQARRIEVLTACPEASGR